jgi:hypothetical protein
MYITTKLFEDSLTCGCDSTDSVRYHLRANKVDLSLKDTSFFKKSEGSTLKPS